MNPNNTIRPWLLACGLQYGIRQAHEYRWADADTRQHEMYCIYRMINSKPIHDGFFDFTTSVDYDALRKTSQIWYTTVEVDLYNSQDGLYELASFVVAAKADPVIQNLFGDECSLIDVPELQNVSTFDDEIINYHHQMVCVFQENIVFELLDQNAIVETIEFKLEDGMQTHTIDDTGTD